MGDVVSLFARTNPGPATLASLRLPEPLPEHLCIWITGDGDKCDVKLDWRVGFGIGAFERTDPKYRLVASDVTLFRAVELMGELRGMFGPLDARIGVSGLTDAQLIWAHQVVKSGNLPPDAA